MLNYIFVFSFGFIGETLGFSLEFIKVIEFEVVCSVAMIDYVYLVGLPVFVFMSMESNLVCDFLSFPLMTS